MVTLSRREGCAESAHAKGDTGSSVPWYVVSLREFLLILLFCRRGKGEELVVMRGADGVRPLFAAFTVHRGFFLPSSALE